MQNVSNKITHHASIVILLTLFLYAPAGFSNAMAKGWCRGDEERFRGLVEKVEFRLGMLEEQIKAATVSLTLHTRPVLGALASWTLYMRALAVLSAELRKSEPGIRSILDGKFKTIWNDSNMVRAWINMQAPGQTLDSQGFQLAFKKALLPFAICRSIKAKNPAACKILNEFEPSLTSVCTDFFIDVGLLLSGNCEKGMLAKAAKLWNVPAYYLDKRCKIFSSSDPGRCSDLDMASAVDLAACWAVTGNDSNWCYDPGLDRQQSQECYKTFVMAMRLKNSSDSALVDLHGFEPYELAALKALMNKNTSCSKLAIVAFERSLSSHFFLRLSAFGALPGFR